MGGESPLGERTLAEGPGEESVLVDLALISTT